MSRDRATREETHLVADAVDRLSVERALAGDRNAFALLVDRHAPTVHAICVRMVRNPAIAEELAQESFARAWSALSTYRQDAQFRHWLLRIAVNLCRDHLKAGERRENGWEADDELHAAPVDPSPDPERRAVGRQELQQLERAIAQLPDKYREAFVLKHVEDLSYEEIQAIVGGQISMLKVRVFRAREMLRKILGESS